MRGVLPIADYCEPFCAGVTDSVVALTINEAPLTNALCFGDANRSLVCSLQLTEGLSAPPCGSSETPGCRPEHLAGVNLTTGSW